MGAGPQGVEGARTEEGRVGPGEGLQKLEPGRCRGAAGGTRLYSLGPP